MLKKILKNSVFTVSEYIEFLNNILSECQAKIEGEIDQVKKSSKGHVYFSIKDENGSILDCVIWNYYYKLCGLDLKEGLRVIVSGAPDIYPKSGRLNFKTSFIELLGDGALKKQYEELKEKLEKEGAFERKLKIKKYSKTIGVVTSKHGAVIHDFLNNLGKYGFKIEFIDSRVEGMEAIEDLILSFKTFKKRNLDCLVVIRGGGSKNSFDIFNNESVIREIIDYPCPVIAGLGHHEDETLFAKVADYSVSTPTAVAHFLNTSYDKLFSKLKTFEQVIFEKYINLISNLNYKLEHLKNNLINKYSLNLKNLKEKLNYIEKEIHYCNPKTQLKLGYSIVRKNGKVIKSIKNIEKEDLIDLELADGIINSKVYGKKQK